MSIVAETVDEISVFESSQSKSASASVKSKPGKPKQKPNTKTSGQKRTRRVLTLEEKYRIVKEVQNGKKQADVAELFNPPLCQSTVATIVKNKKEIMRAYEEGLFINKRKKMTLFE